MVELSGAAGRAVKGYSTGMKQRLALACALLGDPEVLLLDEPANGLDPEGMKWLRGFLRAQAAEGRTVLVSSHVLAEIEQTVDHVLIISKGKLLAQGPIAQLAAGAAAVVRVRSPQAQKLEELLLQKGAGREPPGHGARHPRAEQRRGRRAGARATTSSSTSSSRSSPAWRTSSCRSPARGGRSVIDLLRAEFLKLRSTRTALGLFIAALVVSVLPAVLVMSLVPRDALVGR